MRLQIKTLILKSSLLLHCTQAARDRALDCNSQIKAIETYPNLSASLKTSNSTSSGSWLTPSWHLLMFSGLSPIRVLGKRQGLAAWVSKEKSVDQRSLRTERNPSWLLKQSTGQPGRTSSDESMTFRDGLRITCFQGSLAYQSGSFRGSVDIDSSEESDGSGNTNRDPKGFSMTSRRKEDY